MVKDVARIMTDHSGHEMSEWIATGLPGIRRFARGLTLDLEAVTAGLTLPYSSGAVEGNVNRLKTLKPQMYGRANLDLLRKRVLLAR